MNTPIILLSAGALSVLLYMTLAHIASDMTWLMRILARSQITDLLLHFWIFSQFATSGHALIGAEIAGLTMSYFFWKYRRDNGYYHYYYATKLGFLVDGDIQTCNAALNKHFADYPADAIKPIGKNGDTFIRKFRWL